MKYIRRPVPVEAVQFTKLMAWPGHACEVRMLSHKLIRDGESGRAMVTN